jgi:hypothetical protein
MSLYETLSLLISIAGSIGVIVSLWIWNRQTQIFNSQLMEGITQTITDYSLEISRLFIAHPEVRPYFFEGQTIDKSDPNYLQAEAIAEVILDIFWTMRSQAQRIQNPAFRNAGANSIWSLYVGDCFASSPLLTSFLQRRKDWYGDDLVKLMEDGLARARQQTS